MRTAIYVDGFNLYFGSLKRTAFKWLNIHEMVKGHLQPHHQICSLKYFTANVNPRPGNPDVHNRQALYCRALMTVPDTEIILGHYLTKTVPMPLAFPVAGLPSVVQVIKTEEKGSDVNLAAAMIHDAHLNRYDCAVVVSGDSDLLAPVRLVKEELGKVVGVINPQKRPCRVLVKTATFYMHTRPAIIAKSVFAPVLTDAKGQFSKPPRW